VVDTSKEKRKKRNKIQNLKKKVLRAKRKHEIFRLKCEYWLKNAEAQTSNMENILQN